MSDFSRTLSMRELNTAKDSAGNIVTDAAGNIVVAVGVFYCHVSLQYPLMRPHSWIIEDSFGDRETITFSPGDALARHDFPKYIVTTGS